MKLFFFDLETTGLDVETSEIIQVGGILRQPKKDIEINELFKPKNEKISIRARSVHGHTIKKLKDKPVFGKDEKEKTYNFLKKIEKNIIWIAHNGKSYDIPIITKYNIEPQYHIDTLKLARLLLEEDYEELEQSYALIHLKYYFIDKGFLKEEDLEGLALHDAFGDVKLLSSIFDILVKLYHKRFYNDLDITKEDTLVKIYTEMVTISANPLLLNICPLKKHKGKKMINVPTDYLVWINNNMDLEEDLKHTVNYHLNLRMN